MGVESPPRWRIPPAPPPRPRVAKAAVHRDVRLGANQPAERHELVDPDVVVLHALPRGVLARRPPVALADAVAPVVAAHEVAAGPAVDRRVQLAQQRQRVGAEALDVVGRHERHGADPDSALSAGGDLQPRVIGRCAGREGNRIRPVALVERPDGHRLPVRRPGAPHEADFDRPGLRRALQRPAAAGVARASHDAEAGLGEARRPARAVQLELRRVRPHERLRPRHRHAARLAEDRPRRLPFRHGVEELPVVDHLGPDATVDAAAQMLDELAVDVLRHRRGRADAASTSIVGPCARPGAQAPAITSPTATHDDTHLRLIAASSPASARRPPGNRDCSPNSAARECSAGRTARCTRRNANCRRG